MKYKTNFNGQLITGTYNEICRIIANSGLMSKHRITKINKI